MLSRLLTTACLTLIGLSVGHAEGIQGNARFSPRPAVSHVPVSQNTLAPFAYIRFCVANPNDCRISSGPEKLEWDQRTQDTLATVNANVNRRIAPRADRVESWDADVSNGDCEDYALTKRRALLAKGFAPGALRMATATTSMGEWHAVLVVSTTAGDMVLDNRTAQIRTWNRTGLRWAKIASAEDPRIWLAVRGGARMSGAEATASARYQVRSNK